MSNARLFGDDEQDAILGYMLLYLSHSDSDIENATVGNIIHGLYFVLNAYYMDEAIVKYNEYLDESLKIERALQS